MACSHRNPPPLKTEMTASVQENIKTHKRLNMNTSSSLFLIFCNFLMPVHCHVSAIASFTHRTSMQPWIRSTFPQNHWYKISAPPLLPPLPVHYHVKVIAPFTQQPWIRSTFPHDHWCKISILPLTPPHPPSQFIPTRKSSLHSHTSMQPWFTSTSHPLPLPLLGTRLPPPGTR